MRKFDYTFLKDGSLSGRIINITTSIYESKVMAKFWSAANARIFTELEKIAIVQSVKSSNEIEGIVTTDERIKSIVNRITDPKNHDEKEIVGYRDALNKIHTDYQHIDFELEDILSLHKTLTTEAGYKDSGVFKTVNNYIMAIDSDGNRTLRFMPVRANETPKAMEQLVFAYMDARCDPDINQLWLIPCVILDFLCIHPFIDGNGRMSRLLSLLLLYKNGFDVGKYVSYEEQINKNKGEYYKALGESSINWHEGENDYVPFIKYFLKMLNTCYKELDRRFDIVDGKPVSKKDMIERTVRNNLAPISKADICRVLPEVSTTTIENVLGNLVKEGKIMKVGSARNVRYVKNSNK